MSVDTQLHDWDVHLQWCRRCGLNRIEVIEQERVACLGLAGVTHARYLAALTNARGIFDPILKSLGIQP